jgi:hypothetical protein
MRKVYLRVLPIAALSYFFCYLDRINVGFAARDRPSKKTIEIESAVGSPLGQSRDVL